MDGRGLFVDKVYDTDPCFHAIFQCHYIIAYYRTNNYLNNSLAVLAVHDTLKSEGINIDGIPIVFIPPSSSPFALLPFKSIQEAEYCKKNLVFCILFTTEK